MHPNPYAAELGALDPITALAETPREIEKLAAQWTHGQWEQSYAPGKWTARQIIAHLTQTELALTTRVRFAASQEQYVAQSFDQDAWIPLDDRTDGTIALEAYVALRRFNLAMFKGLTPQQRSRPFTHPEFGALTPEWVAAQMAGHELHHLRQLRSIK